MRPLRAALYVQLAFFAGWGAYLLTSHQGGKVLWLETAPVDPRDLISGHYVALSYPINQPAASDCPGFLSKPGRVWVRLRPSGRRIETAEGPVEAWDAVECASAPRSDGEVWASASIERGWRNRAIFGIERFYVNENSPLRTAQSGQVVAKVSSNGRELRILDLIRRRP